MLNILKSGALGKQYRLISIISIFFKVIRKGGSISMNYTNTFSFQLVLAHSISLKYQKMFGSREMKNKTFDRRIYK